MTTMIVIGNHSNKMKGNERDLGFQSTRRHRRLDPLCTFLTKVKGKYYTFAISNNICYFYCMKDHKTESELYNF